MSTYEKVAEADSTPRRSRTPMVVFASSLGTVFEWYDFFLVGALATNISQHMFSGLNPTAAFILTLLSFASGFAVRPLGAAVFGRLGDVFGRKYTFLVTIVIMGSATFLIGLIPDYRTIGIVAPVAFVSIRMLQGLALGGEYGGAVTYVAEHSVAARRGFFTSWIQVTAGLGLLLSLLVILVARESVGDDRFAAWGWRVPFLSSAILLGISVWVRMKLSESPVFLKMKQEGRQSRAPLKEALTDRQNLKRIFASMFGPVIGEAVVWYTGQFYALYFLIQSVKVSPNTANVMMVVATIVTLPLYVGFGSLSDRFGRKPVMMGGCLLAVIFFFPLFHALTHYLNPALERAERQAPTVLYANPDECSIQFNPVGTAKFTRPCDVAKAALAKAGIQYENRAVAGADVHIEVGSANLPSVGGGSAADVKQFEASLGKMLSDNGYPTGSQNSESSNYVVGTLILAVLMVFGIMLYGPIGAFMVELFPARIRYTSMSLPYHVGIGWFGGFLPATSFAIVAATGNPYAGLWYPVIIAAVSFVVSLFFVSETRNNTLD